MAPLQVDDRVVGRALRVQGKRGTVVTVHNESRQRWYDVLWDAGGTERVAARSLCAESAWVPPDAQIRVSDEPLSVTAADDEGYSTEDSVGDLFGPSSSDDDGERNDTTADGDEAVHADSDVVVCHGVEWRPVTSILVDARTQMSHATSFRWPSTLQLGAKEHIKYFYLFYPMSTLQEMVTFTNVVLTSRRYGYMSIAEFFRWLGVRLAMVYEPCRGGVKAYWSTEEQGDRVDTPRNYASRFHMTRHRFEQILNGLTFVDTSIRAEDPWSPIRPMVDGFNQRRQSVVHAGDLLVVDECMVGWEGVELKYHANGIPHKTKIPRKPVSQGAELKAIADGSSGILLGLEIMEGKEKQQAKPYCAEFGDGTAIVLRLASPFASTGRTVIADSAFASVKTLVQLEKLMGLSFMGMVKTATKQFPMKSLKSWFSTEPPRGSHITYESRTPLGNPMYAMCWADKKPKTIIANRGTTVQGSDSVRIRHRVVMKNGVVDSTERREIRVRRPQMIELFYSRFSAVDVHDHYRQGTLSMEQGWKTQTWWHRVFASLFGMIVTDAYLAYRYENVEVMSPSQASSDDFPRLSGSRNFDVWKARVMASLDGKHLLGFVTKKDYDGVSDDEEDDSASGSDMSDVEEPTKTSSPANEDSDVVDYGSSSEELRPDSDDDDPAKKTTASAKRDPSPVRSFSQRKADRERAHARESKPSAPTSRRLRRMEAQTKAFLMKTMDDTHIRLVKNLTTAYDIFQAICKKYEGATFHGDPYFILHYLMETKYEEGSDLNKFFLDLEDAMKAASKATEALLTDVQKSLYLFHSMPSSWKDDLRIWKGSRKYIPYDELKMSIETKVREMQAQARYSLMKGSPESSATKNERALIAPTNQAVALAASSDNVCSYCQKPRHNIRQCRGLQKDLRDGNVKPGTVLPANFSYHGGTSHRSHPYERDGRNSGRGRGSWQKGGRGRGRGGRGGQNRDNTDGNKGHQSRRSEGGYDQSRREEARIAVATVIRPVPPAISLTAQASSTFDSDWTVDSGCSSHVTQHAEWFSSKVPATGSITVGGKAEIPIEGTGDVELHVTDSKGKQRKMVLHDVLYAPQLCYNLLSVPAAVEHDYRFTFKRTLCTVQTDQRFNIKATKSAGAKLYQFKAAPVPKQEAHVAISGTR